MASLPATESDYDFVEEPSEDFFCPVTFEFLREPHLTACCGNHLSHVAVTRLQGQPCPLCNEPNPITVLDKFFKRKVNELKVRCPNKSLGCEWVGELGSLDRHLSQNSVEGECQFVTVACSCGDNFRRCQLQGHTAKQCSNRPYICRYCNHEATYSQITNDHWPICKQYPLECPNECGENAIERQHLQKHLEETCPLQTIKENLAAFEAAMQEKGRLDQTIVPCVFVGPPGMGKTSLMRKLTGKPPLPSLPSNGVADKVVQVEIKPSSSTAAQVVSSVWSEMTLDDEAVTLLMDISQNLSSDGTAASSHASSPTASSDFQAKLLTDAETMPPSSFKPPLEMFKEALRAKDQDAALEFLEGACIVYLTDTGGQLEFQELLPALTSGPSVFFLVFRLDQDLNKRFTVEYRHPSGNSKPYNSSYTVKEFLLHTLASIASMDICRYGSAQEEVVGPKVFLVGTHKDKVSKTEIEQMEKDLLQDIKCTDHFKKGIIQFASEDHLILAVDNLSTDDADAQLLRSAVERISKRGQFNVSAPPQWLIFSLAIRRLKESVLTYDECFAMAKECGIVTHAELSEVLRFLSTKGLIRHFQGTDVDKDLQEIVIQDPQVVFNKITELIIATFTFENVNPFACEEFNKKGIFSQCMFENISSRERNKLLTPSRLLKLLQHLHIIAPIKEVSGETKYFIPCVLAHTAAVSSIHADNSEMTSEICSKVPPLLACFDCGYCPKGVFCSLAVYLLNDQMKSRLSWELESNEIFRDQISFTVGPDDSVSLKITSKFIEICCTSNVPNSSREITFSSVCREVRCVIERGLRDVALTLHYSCNAAHFLAFYCPFRHPAKAVYRYRQDVIPCRRMCSECSQKRYDLSEDHKLWFSKVQEVISEGDRSKDGTHVCEKMTHRCDEIVDFLAANVAPERLADRLLTVNLVGDDIRQKASIMGITSHDKIRPLLKAVITRIKLNAENYDKFVSVLKQLVLTDLIQFIESPL